MKSLTKVICVAVLSSVCIPLGAQPGLRDNQFLFGASVYPELQTRDEWNRMIDGFARAGMNVVRVSESSWGNLETAPGVYNFGWLHDFLDDVARNHMKAILGTSTYIAPQWLAAKNPDMLVQLQPGVSVHPMGRKAACINHPAYRAACRRYITAIGREFKDHPAVIGWQLDNEIEFLVGQVCYNQACERAWQEWLRRTYHSPDELNRRWLLVSWGLKIDSFDDVPQVRDTVDPHRPPIVALANLHFHRDNILDFFREQTEQLREAGVKQWITTDWNNVWTAIADDPRARESLDIASLNFYPPSASNPNYWTDLSWHHDMLRSAHGLGRFLITEARIGVAGETTMSDPFPSREQFRMWMLQPTAFGAAGLLYWSGNRWRGGHWPHWGGLLDWTGQQEPDFPWVTEIGAFFEKWGERLLSNPVDARVALISDFDQRAALSVYPHTPASLSVVREAADVMHRLGTGVDSLNSLRAADAAQLSRYTLVVVPAATALDGTSVTSALTQYVTQGGRVLITPFTAYQSWDGVFRGDGFGANLKDLTGVIARTARRMGTAADAGRADQHVNWKPAELPGAPVRSAVGADGYCEFLDVSPEAQVIATFESAEPLLDGRPAATRRKIGKGVVIKMAFWPKDDSLLELLERLTALHWDSHLARFLPPGVQAVPRTDRSLFLINTAGAPATIELAGSAHDRISGKRFSGRVALAGYGMLWLE